MNLKSLLILTTFILLSCGQKSKIEDSSTVSIDTPKKSKKSIIVEQRCSFDNSVSDLGIGVIIVPESFEIYNDSLLTDKFASLNMYKDVIKINLCPIFFKPDYGIMHFACVKETQKSFKILTGFSEMKYLPKNKQYKFHSWDNYITNSFGIRRKLNQIDKSVTQQPLQKEPLENSEIITIPKGIEMFCPIEIKGEWIKVKYDCFYNQENNKNEGKPCHTYIDKCSNPITGWLKWKNKNELLIDIFLMP